MMARHAPRDRTGPGTVDAEPVAPADGWTQHERLVTRRVRSVFLVLVLVLLAVSLYSGYRVRLIDAEIKEFSLRVVPLQQLIGQLQRSVLEQRRIVRELVGADPPAGPQREAQVVSFEEASRTTHTQLGRALQLSELAVDDSPPAHEYERVDRLLRAFGVELEAYERAAAAWTAAAPGPEVSDPGAADALEQRADALGRRVDQVRLLFEVYAKSMAQRVEQLGGNARWLVGGVATGQLMLVLLLGAYLRYSINRIHRRQRQQEQRELRQRDELAHLSRVTTAGGLVAGLAHELNQPMQAIATRADAARLSLERHAADPAASRDTRDTRDPRLAGDLDAIAAQATRAGQIISRLRSFVARREPHRQPISVNTQVHATFALLRSAGRLDGVRLSARLEPGLAPVTADPIHLQQVLMNLIQNAVDAVTAAEGPDTRDPHVRVESQKLDGGRVELRVVDNGPPMADEQVEQIFQPFFTTKGDGLGVGLAISRSLVEAIGGTLHAAANPDQGMTFTVRLPVATGYPPPSGVASGRTDEPASPPTPPTAGVWL